VIHRDVSTANIIVSEDGKVKLTDFGLAKGSADLSVTESGGMVGSPYYISPEQVRSNTGCDQRSDIYSTGVVLYELLTGHRPFENESTFLLMQAHVQHVPQPPVERNPAIPIFISEAILKALAKKPTDRFQNAAEFLAALEGPAERSAPAPKVVAVQQPVAPPAPSHSYAAPIPPETIPSQPARARFFLPKSLQSPVAMATLGIGIVAAAVAPVFFYDFEEGKSRFANATPLSLPEPVRKDSAPATRPMGDIDPEALSSGPKELPILPVGNGGLTAKRQGSARKIIAPTVAAPPPKIMVWGDARASVAPKSEPVAAATPPLKPEPAAAVSRKIEEPPSLIATPAKATIEPTMPQPGTTVQRRGLFRRFANGVKALNPIRKDNAVQAAPVASIP